MVARYRELGEEEAKAAVDELVRPAPTETVTGHWGHLAGILRAQFQGDLLEKLSPKTTCEQGFSWLLDSEHETASSLLERQLPGAESYGKLLLRALPVQELRRMARSYGLDGLGAKGQLVEKLCQGAQKQRLINSKQALEVLVSQALRQGRWLSLTDSSARRALMLLSELFRLETCGTADAAYVLFSTKWPQFTFQAGSGKHRGPAPRWRRRSSWTDSPWTPTWRHVRPSRMTSSATAWSPLNWRPPKPSCACKKPWLRATPPRTGCVYALTFGLGREVAACLPASFHRRLVPCRGWNGLRMSADAHRRPYTMPSRTLPQ